MHYRLQLWQQEGSMCRRQRSVPCSPGSLLRGVKGAQPQPAALVGVPDLSSILAPGPLPHAAVLNAACLADCGRARLKRGRDGAHASLAAARLACSRGERASQEGMAALQRSGDGSSTAACCWLRCCRRPQLQDTAKVVSDPARTLKHAEHAVQRSRPGPPLTYAGRCAQRRHGRAGAGAQDVR
jgi:hypothetical protein